MSVFHSYAAAHPDLPPTRAVERIEAIDREQWNRLEHGSPFLRWEFLCALERSGSIGGDSGWQPHYLLVEDRGGALLGAVAAFLKDHSYGEYIFDWAWASAARRAGIPYYPKLVIAAPVTPVTGHRLLLAPEADRAAVTAQLAGAVRALADRTRASSIHWLFTTEAEQRRLAELGFAPRASYQFHFDNPGYADFDDFLGHLTSRRRKQIRKERRRVAAEIDGVDFTPAGALDRPELDRIDGLYRRNTARHGGIDYLRPGFFSALAELMPDSFLVARARHGGRLAGMAVYLEGPDTLYGRYWGGAMAIDFLHFEVTCYAGIERCIARGLRRFEAGAQGEHKLLRGFAPRATYSSHWIRDPDLDRAVRGYLAAEADEIGRHMAALAACGPYHRDADR